MMAMLRHVVHAGVRKRRVRRTWFVHGRRSVAARAFTAELDRLAASANGAVRLVPALSAPRSASLPGVDSQAHGRAPPAPLQPVLPLADSHFFLSGPPPLT